MSRTGVHAIEEEDELKLGVNLDPDEQANSFALVEETRHLVGSSGKPQTIGQSRNASASFSRKWIDSLFLPQFQSLGFLALRNRSDLRLGESALRSPVRDRSAPPYRDCSGLVQRFGPRGTPLGWPVNFVVPTAPRPR
jgi:hypothetical protein